MAHEAGEGGLTEALVVSTSPLPPAGQKDPFALSKRMEAFQRGCFSALAAAAGATVADAGPDFDKTDVFVTLLAGKRSFLLQAQLKSTRKLSESDVEVAFTLDMLTYEKLRDPESSSAARVLVLMEIPGEPNVWSSCTEESLNFRRRVYWRHLYEEPPITNGTKRTIKIPKSNLLTADNFFEVMKGVEAARKKAVKSDAKA